jgi:predicted S18 family serine protease
MKNTVNNALNRLENSNRGSSANTSSEQTKKYFHLHQDSQEQDYRPYRTLKPLR